MLLVTDVYARFCQRGAVEGTEGIEVFGIDFRSPVTAHQFIFEEDADLGHHGCAVGAAGGGNFNGGDEVFLTVSTQHTDG